MADKTSLRIAYGQAITKLGHENDKIVVLDADLSSATMTNYFKKEFPDRHFNFGIAEANMMCAAAGFAHSGLIPFASTFAIFGAGRAYEMIRNSIAYVNANVKIACTHAGLSVGEDGGSHQSIEDLALMRVVPNMTVIAPADPFEMTKAVKAAVAMDGPVYLRVARPVSDYVTEEGTPFEIGKAIVLRQSGADDVALFACGLMVPEAIKAADLLAEQGIKASVTNIHTLKPLDVDTIRKMAGSAKAVVTCEEHSVIGGLGGAVAEALMGQVSVKFGMIGVQDKFGKSGKPDQLFAEYHLTPPDIAAKAKTLLG
ncbi:MAG: transketolase family protein [Oscillospiraceae bacterium]